MINLGSGGVPDLGIPFLQNETDYTSANWDSKHLRIAIWPGSKFDQFTSIQRWPDK